MTIRVALEHVTEYHYDRPIRLGPQVVRLRPAPHCRTPVLSYSLRVDPHEHFLNWQQDPLGNFLARIVIPEPTRSFRVAIDLTAELTVINPFDFFVEEYADAYPFVYDEALAEELRPYLERAETGSCFAEYLRGIDRTKRKTTSFLVDLNQRLWQDIRYLIRLEPGVQQPEETLRLGSGSCRDSAWLLVQLLRHCGLAARFVSGYLIQLTADIKSLDGPSGPEQDFTDLHAWCEVFVPGAGWIGLDPTSGLLTGEGHIPLAASREPSSAAPISGGLDECETEFGFRMRVTRVHEDPRVTKPYDDAQWASIVATGDDVDRRLLEQDVRLTMGGEPTFVSIDDMEGAEWNTAAVGFAKQRLSAELIRRLRSRFAPGGLLHFGQGKWYPGESLPRWGYSCMWRTDGEPIWMNEALLADPAMGGREDADTAAEFLVDLAEQLEVEPIWIRPAYEDVWTAIEEEQKLPVDVDPRDFDLDDDEDRRRLARILESGMSRPVGHVLPLMRAWWQADAGWRSGPWPFRSERLFLLPGDSPIGLRLPLESLPAGSLEDQRALFALDPFFGRPPLPGYQEIRRRAQASVADQFPEVVITEQRQTRRAPAPLPPAPPSPAGPLGGGGLPGASTPWTSDGLVRTAMCVEPRGGRLHIFMPPVGRLEDYLDLLAQIEVVAERRQTPVVIEGYLPPPDHRLQVLKVTPDPGVIEVNVQPARNWRELQEITTGVYEEARWARLGTEKFQLDGRHTGTGGGNHIVLGGPTPADSPFLRRPHVLRSLLVFWNNHPSLSYLFAGQFIGPTSQSPRVDEGRRDALYELELACAQIPDQGDLPPWLVDRVFRHLLVDMTGNTHRAEFCIDKLFSPDSGSGRLGLVEFRAFEMPPHARMSLAQQLLVRALVAWMWDHPYRAPLIRWGTALHDRFMLPHFLEEDLKAALRELRDGGIDLADAWFKPHVEFRCPLIGEVVYDDVRIELRTAIEPWYVLGEEPGGGGTTRYVDSSVERLQVLVQQLRPEAQLVICNGRAAPLQPTGRSGEYVAAVRYRAWQPPSCLHPTIPVNTPLVFDLVDRRTRRSLGGCRYHIDHPGGLNPAVYPINALEAESRRAARFWRHGHTHGELSWREPRPSTEFPCTLDLRLGPGAT